MAYRTFRPSGLPYRADSLWSLLSGDTPNPLAPSFVGDGSWSDGSDSTYVSSFARPGTASTVIAVDFDPIPGVVPDSGYGVELRVELVAPTGFGLSYANSVGSTNMHLISGTTDVGQVFPFDDFVPTTAPILTPTTYASADDAYAVFDADLMGSGGFTAAFLIQNAAFDDTEEIWRVFELAFRFDVGGGPPPLRRFPPVNNGGFGPTRHWPRTVNRRAGGTY